MTQIVSSLITTPSGKPATGVFRFRRTDGKRIRQDYSYLRLGLLDPITLDPGEYEVSQQFENMPSVDWKPITVPASGTVNISTLISGFVKPPSGPVLFSTAGFTGGMQLPTKTFSGHPLKWLGEPIPGQFGPRNAFWAVPGSGAVYAATRAAEDVSWGRMRFGFLAGSGGTGGTACIAITSEEMNTPMPGSLRMPVHFWTTRFSWAMTVWGPNQQSVILDGAYSSPLPQDAGLTVLSMSFAIEDNRVLFRTPDGVVRVTPADARFSQFHGPHAFAEAYSPGGTDDVVVVYEAEFGTPSQKPVGLPASA